MAIPTYDALMLPLLRLASDGGVHELGDCTDDLAKQFGLTEEDLREPLPSGRQPLFENRVGWARTYLKKAGLLESPARGKIRITGRGQEVLNRNPDRIDVKLLNQFPEFVGFKTVHRKGGSESPTPAALPSSVLDQQTPQDLLESAYQQLRRELAAELLHRVKTCSPKFFERLVVDLLVAMGYGGSRREAGQAVGRSGDDGIDGIIDEDKLGLDKVYIQAKRWTASVGRPTLQAFAGSLEGRGANKGVLITTSDFTREARDYTQRIQKRIVLVDGADLTDLLIDYGVGVTVLSRYEIKKVDIDYFEETD